MQTLSDGTYDILPVARSGPRGDACNDTPSVRYAVVPRSGQARLQTTFVPGPHDRRRARNSARRIAFKPLIPSLDPGAFDLTKPPTSDKRITP